MIRAAYNKHGGWNRWGASPAKKALHGVQMKNHYLYPPKARMRQMEFLRAYKANGAKGVQ